MRVTGAERGDEDLALVRRCLDGDDEAWRRLVDLHRPGMIALARRILPDAEATDVVDAVIADVWERRKLARYEGRSALGTWLGSIAIHAALNARRSSAGRSRAIAMTTDRSDQRPSQPLERDAQRLADVLSAAIATLDPPNRVLVLMYYEQALSLDEIAIVLQRSKSTLSRALQQAREEIRAAAARLSHERFGTTLAALRQGADLGQLELDLRAACAPQRDRTDPRVSNS